MVSHNHVKRLASAHRETLKLRNGILEPATGLGNGLLAESLTKSTVHELCEEEML